MDLRRSSREGEVRARLSSEGLVAQAWSNGPGDVYAEHRHDYDKVIVAARGSIVFALPELGRALPMSPGDRLELPAETLHWARVGPDGVTCLEAHLARGTLSPEPRLALDWAGPAGPGGSETASPPEA